MESLFKGNSVKSKRIIYTPSNFAKSNLLHLQEVGELTAIKPHENSREGLWNYINRGVLSCVVSDHSPGMPENRSDQHQPTYMSGYGISGVQTMLPVFYDGVIKHGMPVTLAAKCMSSNPAKRWGIYGKKGAVKTGFDADFVIFDDKTEHTICADNLFYKVKLTAFDGDLT